MGRNMLINTISCGQENGSRAKCVRSTAVVAWDGKKYVNIATVTGNYKFQPVDHPLHMQKNAFEYGRPEFVISYTSKTRSLSNAVVTPDCALLGYLVPSTV